jgi:S-formylglutathione hydrolase
MILIRGGLRVLARVRDGDGLLACLILGVAVCQSAGAQSGTVTHVQVPAPSLNGNLVGTPTSQAAVIYLPPSYASSRDRRYPVLYLLHGLYDSSSVWTRLIQLPTIADRLIAKDRLPEMIVVMPDGGNRYGGGYYRNSPVTGRWQDFLAEDLTRFVDGNYRTQGEPDGRAIAGWSMGGYGALHLAMERPGVVSVVYAISPCCLDLVDDIGFGSELWKRAAAIKTPQDVDDALNRKDMFAAAGVGLLGAFDPAPDAPPLYVRFPCQVVGRDLIVDRPAVNRLVAQFAINNVERTASALKSLTALALDYGINDTFAHIPPSTAAFSRRLTELSVPHRLESYEGDHRNQIATRLESRFCPSSAKRLTEARRSRARLITPRANLPWQSSRNAS